jgi:glycosyltransferase involved in cell wall biosynthesis
MRIAYIAPYQGPLLRRSRPIVANLALAANLKISLIAQLLTENGHEVEILSQGEVVEPRAKLYPALEEPLCGTTVQVSYCSALPIRHLNGIWSTFEMLKLLRRKHRRREFQLCLVYNFKQPQAIAALYAKALGIPVVSEYEDDALVDVGGNAEKGLRTAIDRLLVSRVLQSISGCIAVSPHLLSKAPRTIPRMMLRGIIGPEIVSLPNGACQPRKNWVVFSGTHYRSKGLPELIAAWKMLQPQDWELHIAGHGELTRQLENSASEHRTIVFHGLLNREANARLLLQAKIGINPHQLSVTPGNVFAFKIIEYLAAGTHVITTPMGILEPELEAGVTYIDNNRPETIARSLAEVINNGHYQRLAIDAASRLYSSRAVAEALDSLVKEVVLHERGRASAADKGVLAQAWSRARSHISSKGSQS